MTHQYESEVLNKLMERDGINIPSSVPPYEAEIKAYLINQVKQAYPKLTDYEAEWLLYNYTKHLPADFPISSVSNVTEASFENVVPFAYQSAILKGNTLVNISIIKEYSFSSTQVQIKCYNNEMIKTNTEYTVIYDITDTNNLGSVMLDCFGNTPLPITLGSHKIKLTTLTSLKNNSNMYISGDFAGVVDNIMIIEGDYTNQDIPYFEGMKSVKMPVLKATGKNLWDNNNFVNGVINGDSVKLTASNLNDTKFYYKFKENQQYVFALSSYSENKKILYFRYNYTDGTDSGFTFFIPYNGERKYFLSDEGKTVSHISFVFSNPDNYTLSNIQLEEGNVATEYEPFKSNILTVNEDVTLRGIGDIQDELDCLTGEVTERIGEVVLDGSEDWHINKETETHISYYLTINSNMKKMFKALTNSLPCYYWGDVEDLPKECFWSFTSSYGMIVSKTECSTIEEFKQKLNRNPVLLQYELNKSAIKTVDLITINENGETTYFMPLEGTMRVSSSSETIQPTFDMSVPVEATTQNLASFIDLEMEE